MGAKEGSECALVMGLLSTDGLVGLTAGETCAEGTLGLSFAAASTSAADRTLLGLAAG